MTQSDLDYERQIARLEGQIGDSCLDYEKRINQLNEMLEEAMRIFALYLNVPESRALQERWEKLKNAP